MATMYIQTNEEDRVVGYARFPYDPNAFEVECDVDGDLCEYWYRDGEFIHDDEWRAKQEAEFMKDSQMATLKSELSRSDFKILKFAESLLKCSSAADMLSVISGTRDTLSDTIEERAELRKQINELEGNPAEEEPAFEPVDFSDKLADIENALNILLGGGTE